MESKTVYKIFKYLFRFVEIAVIAFFLDLLSTIFMLLISPGKTYSENLGASIGAAYGFILLYVPFLIVSYFLIWYLDKKSKTAGVKPGKFNVFRVVRILTTTIPITILGLLYLLDFLY